LASAALGFKTKSALKLKPLLTLWQVAHLQPHVVAWAKASRGSLQRILDSLRRQSHKLFAIGNMLEVAAVQSAVKQHAREEVTCDNWFYISCSGG
jgi:hypothetical protein